MSVATEAISVEWRASGRGEARCAPNPAYPEGIDIDASEGRQGCTVELPYPAPECGMWMVKCQACGRGIVAITAAGRRDDPRTVKIPCKLDRSNAA